MIICVIRCVHVHTKKVLWPIGINNQDKKGVQPKELITIWKVVMRSVLLYGMPCDYILINSANTVSKGHK